MANHSTGTFDRISLNVLRIMAGFLFIPHGAKKLFGWFGGDPENTAALFSQMGLAGVIEFFGGALILVGLFTRPVAAIACLEMIIAYAIAHMPNGAWPMLNGGELALLYAAVFLVLAARGGGDFSLDGVIASSRAGTTEAEPQERAAAM